MTKRKERSVFAEALGQLLERPDGFTKAQWAEVLDVTPSAISQWLGDRTAPRASVLREILDMAKWQFGPEAVEKFLTVANQPAEAISPIGNRMRPTIRYYMVEPIKQGFERLLGTLTPSAQEVALYQAAEICRALLRGEVPGNAGVTTPAIYAETLRHPLAGGRIKRLNGARACAPLKYAA